jgi:rod shape-determining protein MreC
MDYTSSVKFFNRGPSPVVRLVFFTLLSLLLLLVDSRHQYLESTRNVLSTIIYPVQRLTALPPAMWRSADDFLTLHARLESDNSALRMQNAKDAAQLVTLQGLQAENALLRNMLGMRQRLDLPMKAAEVLYAERDPSRQTVLVNLGQSDVQAGEAVLDGTGLVGQVTRVHPMLSEVTLITDKDREVPVQVVRNGLRLILFGSGKANELDLRYAPINADLQEGDVLETSGIGGTYPPGLPVAKVTHIERDPVYAFARVQCVPLTGVNNQHWLFIVAGLQKLPPPPDAEANGEHGKAHKPERSAR